jgi:hypothetical protein
MVSRDGGKCFDFLISDQPAISRGVADLDFVKGQVADLHKKLSYSQGLLSRRRLTPQRVIHIIPKPTLLPETS